MDDENNRWIGFIFWGVMEWLLVVVYGDAMADYRTKVGFLVAGAITIAIGIWLAPTKDDYE